MSQTLISDLIGALPMPAVFVRADAYIGALNPQAGEILGANLSGRHYITALRQPQVLDAVARCLADKTATQARYLGSDARTETTYQLHCAPVEGGAALLTFQDVTEHEQSAQMRRDFVANVSHELRTPLTALMGFIETLQGPAKGDTAAQTRFLGIMARETARMNRLVGDLLSLSRVEATARRRPTEPVDLCALLTSVTHALMPLAQDSDASLILEPCEDNVTVPGDLDQLKQVFTNLIENALKYGGAGVEVTLSLSTPSYEPLLRTQACRISLRDTGPGFDPLHIPRLTERFYRIDSHRSREMGGTGLGLAITKHIIERHRGRLEITSAEGQGAEFTVILPLT